MNYASTGGIIFASYAEAVTLKDSHFYKIEGLGGPPIDIRSTAQTIVIQNNTFDNLKLADFFYIAQSNLAYSHNSVENTNRTTY